jgi:LPS export ABC transporter protein LptC
MILFLFKPLDIKEQKVKDVPMLELENFESMELNEKGLSALTKGTKGIRYSNRYYVTDLDYTDNADEYMANIKSDSGIYKDDIINLSGNIVYKREDGFIFKTQKASYNTKTKIAESKTSYVSQMDGHIVNGSSIKYNNALGILDSKNVIANYKLKER